MNKALVALVAAVVVMATTSAQPFNRKGHLSIHNGIDASSGPSKLVAVNPYPGDGEDVSDWMAVTRSLITPPEHPFTDRPGPSVYDDYHPPSREHVKSALARTLWFEEFPHDRAILNWQQKRQQQGLPLYQLNSQRPGFPFYSGN